MTSWLAALCFATAAFAAAVPTFEHCCSRFGWCAGSDVHCGGAIPPTTQQTTVRPKPGNVPYGAWIEHCTRPGFVALTFDDGPYLYTSSVLDILKANGVLATFFLNGVSWGADDIYSPTRAALVVRMIAEGHQVGSHTWGHKDLSTLWVSDMTLQMTKLESAFLSIIGMSPTYMRPPYLSCEQNCRETMGNLGYHVIHMDLNTEDWQYDSPETIHNSENIFANAIKAANPASQSFIALAHDVHENTVNSLVQSMITTLKNRGFKATTVGNCLGDDKSNWYRTAQ